VLALEFAMDFRPVRLDLATTPLLVAGGSKPRGLKCRLGHLFRPRPSQTGQLGSDRLSDARRVHRAIHREIHRVRGARCDLGADAIFVGARKTAAAPLEIGEDATPPLGAQRFEALLEKPP
jgi:hypothetical protein